MKLRITLLAFGIAVLPLLLAAQGTRINERMRLALRAGLCVGTNLSLYSGDVPVLPKADNTFYATGHGSNFAIGGFIEKPFSSSVVFGAALGYEPMSGSIDNSFTEPFRIADGNGNVYTVVRNYKVDYSLHYLTLAAYTKVYPLKNTGIFLNAGLHLSVLMKNLYYYGTATIKQPEQYLGASYTEGEHVNDAKALRTSIDFGFGYEISTTYAFITPEVHYDLGLSKVIDTAWSDNWGINNLRLQVSISFPLITI
jgi:hypothetical protein